MARPTYQQVRLPLMFKAANALGAVAGFVSRGGVPSLAPASLWVAAERRAGMRREREEPLIDARLGLLVRSLEDEAELTALGRYGARELIVRALANRLMIARALGEFPDIAATPVEAPVFIAGFPRTGTTLLYQLLALHPQVRAPLLWEVLEPAPPPLPIVAPREERPYKAIKLARPFHQFLKFFAQVHAFDPLSPEECSVLRNNTLASEGFFLNGYIPTYLRWLSELDRAVLTASFEEYRNQIQLLAYHFPGRQWVSKSPMHGLHLESLLAVFPDARILRTTREPAECVASAASLFAIGHAYVARRVRPREIGQVIVKWLHDAEAAVARARATAPAEQIRDVSYAELTQDPVGTVRGICEELRLGCPAAYEAAMQRWLTEQPRHKHGQHHYALAEFGLTEADLAPRAEATDGICRGQSAPFPLG